MRAQPAQRVRWPLSQEWTSALAGGIGVALIALGAAALHGRTSWASSWPRGVPEVLTTAGSLTLATLCCICCCRRLLQESAAPAIAVVPEMTAVVPEMTAEEELALRRDLAARDDRPSQDFNNFSMGAVGLRGFVFMQAIQGRIDPRNFPDYGNYQRFCLRFYRCEDFRTNVVCDPPRPNGYVQKYAGYANRDRAQPLRPEQLNPRDWSWNPGTGHPVHAQPAPANPAPANPPANPVPPAADRSARRAAFRELMRGEEMVDGDPLDELFGELIEAGTRSGYTFNAPVYIGADPNWGRATLPVNPAD
jgi:hypothetical protein